MQDKLGEIPVIEVIHPQPGEAAMGNAEMLAAGEGCAQQVAQQPADGAAVQNQQQMLAAMAVQQCPPGGGEAIPGGGEGRAAGGRDGAGETVVVLQSVRILPPQGGDIAALPGAEVNLPEARFDLEWQAPPNGEMLGKRPAALQGGAQHPLPAPVAFEGGGHLPPALSREGRIGAAAKDIAPLAGAVAQQVEGGGAVS